MSDRVGGTHLERKRLFAQGLRRHYLTVGEIDGALPPSTTSPLERWLFYYSIRAAQIEVRGELPPNSQRH